MKNKVLVVLLCAALCVTGAKCGGGGAHEKVPPPKSLPTAPDNERICDLCVGRTVIGPPTFPEESICPFCHGRGTLPREGK